MVRSALAALIVLGLAAAIWWLWPGRVATTPSTTLSQAIESTTTEATVTTTPSTTTSNGATHVVETIEEAERILRELWFGWFEGIYNQDEDRIREVVATEEQVDQARAQFGVMEFTAPPTADAIAFLETEILRSDDECLAAWAEVSGTFRPGSSTGVHVVRRYEDEWRFMSYWTFREDLWANDCEALLSQLSS